MKTLKKELPTDATLQYLLAYLVKVGHTTPATPEKDIKIAFGKEVEEKFIVLKFDSADEAIDFFKPYAHPLCADFRASTNTSLYHIKNLPYITLVQPH